MLHERFDRQHCFASVATTLGFVIINSSFPVFVAIARLENGEPRLRGDERIARFLKIIRTEKNGRQIKTLTLTLGGATLLTLASLRKHRECDTDPAFNHFIQHITALSTR